MSQKALLEVTGSSNCTLRHRTAGPKDLPQSGHDRCTDIPNTVASLPCLEHTLFMITVRCTYSTALTTVNLKSWTCSFPRTHSCVTTRFIPSYKPLFEALCSGVDWIGSCPWRTDRHDVLQGKGGSLDRWLPLHKLYTCCMNL
jgi:hypothetical protein